MASRKNVLTHVDKEGKARMVDVTPKPQAVRVARAEALSLLSEVIAARSAPKPQFLGPFYPDTLYCSAGEGRFIHDKGKG